MIFKDVVGTGYFVKNRVGPGAIRGEVQIPASKAPKYTRPACYSLNFSQVP
jgi:hypothetical protein